MFKPLSRKAALGVLWLALVIASYSSGATHVWADVQNCTNCDCKPVNCWSTGDGKTYAMFSSSGNSSTNYPEALAFIYALDLCQSGHPVQGTQTVYKWYWTGRTFKCNIQNGDSFTVECNTPTGTPTYLGEGATTQLVCSGS